MRYNNTQNSSQPASSDVKQAPDPRTVHASTQPGYEGDEYGRSPRSRRYAPAYSLMDSKRSKSARPQTPKDDQFLIGFFDSNTDINDKSQVSLLDPAGR